MWQAELERNDQVQPGTSRSPPLPAAALQAGFKRLARDICEGLEIPELPASWLHHGLGEKGERAKKAMTDQGAIPMTLLPPHQLSLAGS